MLIPSPWSRCVIFDGPALPAQLRTALIHHFLPHVAQKTEALATRSQSPRPRYLDLDLAYDPSAICPCNGLLAVGGLSGDLVESDQ